MIVQNIYLGKYRWSIKVYYAVTSIYTDAILQDLRDIECTNKDLASISNLLTNFEYNTGFTYSSFENRSSIVVIGMTTSAEEFQDTFDHEKGHLAMHIATALDIYPLSEKYQYLTGEIGKRMFKVAKKFLCNSCRHNMEDLFKKEG